MYIYLVYIVPTSKTVYYISRPFLTLLYLGCLIPEPDTEIIGGPEIFIDLRSTINLTCVIEHTPQPPDFILWEHNSKVGAEAFDRAEYMQNI